MINKMSKTFEDWLETLDGFTKANLQRFVGTDVLKQCWQAAQPQWQPIETAPLDTEILIYDPENGVVVGQIYQGESGNWCSHGCFNPTHWMLLPNPPS